MTVCGKKNQKTPTKVNLLAKIPKHRTPHRWNFRNYNSSLARTHPSHHAQFPYGFLVQLKPQPKLKKTCLTSCNFRLTYQFGATEVTLLVVCWVSEQHQTVGLQQPGLVSVMMAPLGSCIMLRTHNCTPLITNVCCCSSISRISAVTLAVAVHTIPVHGRLVPEKNLNLACADLDRRQVIILLWQKVFATVEKNI